MATHDTQNVSYMRKDEHFLADGTWYLTVVCPIHGMLDEEVSWEDAKTPHHAGVIADERHHECQRKASEEEMKKVAEDEIRAAEVEVERVEALLESAAAEVKQIEASDPEHPLYARMVKQARDRHEELKAGPDKARKRLKDITRHNRRKTAHLIKPHNPS